MPPNMPPLPLPLPPPDDPLLRLRLGWYLMPPIANDAAAAGGEAAAAGGGAATAFAATLFLVLLARRWRSDDDDDDATAAAACGGTVGPLLPSFTGTSSLLFLLSCIESPLECVLAVVALPWELPPPLLDRLDLLDLLDCRLERVETETGGLFPRIDPSENASARDDWADLVSPPPAMPG